MSAIEALILGLIQGLTEFLPVSSSGHLELGSFFLGTQSEDNLIFSILVHGATALSTIVVFRQEILKILLGLFKFSWNDETQFALKIALSMIPVGIVGVLFEDQVESLFGGKILLVGAMLLVTAALLSFTYFNKKHEGQVSFLTISTALLLGVNKEKAARFSFLMVLPPIIGAMLLKTKDLFEAPELSFSIPTLSLVVGFLAAFISGVFACKWMISIVQKGKLIYFAVYCGIVGLLAVVGGLFFEY